MGPAAAAPPFAILSQYGAAPSPSPRQQQQRAAISPAPVGSWSLIQALPREVLADLIERLLATGREAQAIALCGSDRETRRICQETTIDPRRLGLGLTGRYSLIDAARALTIARDPRRCILWAWLLATQAILDADARRGAYTPAQRARIGRRRAQLARQADLNRVPLNDLLLWATNRSPETMPPKAQRILADDAARPYLWRQLIARAYGGPAGEAPYGMAPRLYADPSDWRSTLVSIDEDDGEDLPQWATLLDEAEITSAAAPLSLPSNFVRLPLDQRQAAVRTPEYAVAARARIVDALTRALDDTPLAGSDCARRLFDLFDVRVFVAPGTLRLGHYASVRLRPDVDVSPFDPIDYWTTP